MEQLEQLIRGAEASEGGDNAFYLASCMHVQHRPAYAACLCKIEDRKKGRLEGMPECSAAIGRKDCPALPMRQEEILAGKAIYFVSRKELQAQAQAAAAARGHVFAQMAEQGRDWAPSKTKRPKVTAAPAAPAPSIDYAAAINKAMSAATAAAAAAKAPELGSTAESATRPAVESKSVSADLAAQAVSSTAGLSMLEIARRARQATSAHAA